MTIPNSDITIENINRLIQLYDKEYGLYDEVLRRLFKNADNTDHDNVFCRVGLLDLIYSTGIQRFNKGGIEIVTKHIMNLHEDIDETKYAEVVDYALFDKLREVEYKNVSLEKGRENMISVFASKFLSFTNPDVYPIMDFIVKNAIGYSEEAYKGFCDKLAKFKIDKIDTLKSGDKYSLKTIDKFLWMWGKEKSKV